MKLLMFAIFALAAAHVHALSFSSLALVILSTISLNKPAQGFFNFFRRRSPPRPVEEIASPPEGPVKFPGFMNQFGGYPGFPNFPGFAGGMQGGGFGAAQSNQWNFPPMSQFPPQSSQSWSSSSQFSSKKSPDFTTPPSRENLPKQSSQSWSQSQMPPMSSQQWPSDSFSNQDESRHDFEGEGSDQAPPINAEEADSFFTLLAETDENKCISRMVCEMGADPASAGELGTTINEIIGGLTDFPDGSKVHEYNQILQDGKGKGLSYCKSHYSTCDDESYVLTKSTHHEDGENANDL